MRITGKKLDQKVYYSHSFDYDSKTRTAADDYALQVRDNLEAQTKVIEGNIQGLKQFETEYRARLTEFLGQLVSQMPAYRETGTA